MKYRDMKKHVKCQVATLMDAMADGMEVSVQDVLKFVPDTEDYARWERAWEEVTTTLRYQGMRER